MALIVVPSLAFAQATAAPSKDKEAETYSEIERGVYFGVEGGFNFLLNAPNSGPSSLGQMAAVEIGYDIGDRLSIGGFVQFSANRAGADYFGKSGGVASGDFSALVPGAVVRGNLVGFNDNQEVRRTWIYVRGGAGYVLFSPKQLLPDPDILVFAGPGIEYYTRLRHFSVALEVTGSYLVTSGSLGFQITPNLRYAF
ncbi:MAG: adventurous gliding motility protein CglE [Myxococcaceae bacterium]